MNKTNIDYLNYTWNPTHGCSPISEGCRSCWANIMAKRLAGMGARGYSKEDPFKPTFCPWELDKPLKVKKPSVIGVSFMGDLFNEEITDHQVFDIFQAMVEADRHIYMILTKRPHRMKEFFDSLEDWESTQFPYIYLGVSCENQARADERISTLLQIPAAKHFVSLEPLLGPVDFYSPAIGDPLCRCSGCMEMTPDRIDWVIVGGESGPRARPMHPDWVRSVRDQCIEAGVPFFFKQWGEWYPFGFGHYISCSSMVEKKPMDWDLRTLSFYDGRPNLTGHFQTYTFDDDEEMYRIGKKQAGRFLDGCTWDEMP